MPGGFALLGALSQVQPYNPDSGGSSNLQLLTAPAANNAKGAWTTLTASTTADVAALLVQISYGNAAGTNKAVDIGVGGAGSEVAIIPNLSGYNSALNGEFSNNAAILIPIGIPAGTRLSARYQTSGSFATDICEAGVIAFGGGFTQSQGCAYVDAIGYDTTNTQGTLITSPLGANAKGSYAQLTASTSRDYVGFFLAFDTAVVNGGGSANYRVDTAVGAGGSEQIILPDLMFRFSTTGEGIGSMNTLCPFIPFPIPAGTRIAMRCQCQTAQSTVRGTFYGVG